jgi:hypothetical protein
LSTSTEITLLRRNLGRMAHIAGSRIRGRSYVPHPRAHLFIEPVSYCNLDCAFCACRLDLRPRAVMPTDRFIDIVDQAAAMGFRAIVLTPMLGDVLGDLAEHPLAELLSPRNPAYMGLIESQEAGRFAASCRSCSFYRSIYDDRTGPQPFGLPMVTHEDFLRLIGASESPPPVVD